MSAGIGVLLLNLGTPRSPTPRAVRRYLREFLGDPRVLDIPAPARRLLLETAILPFRPRQSAAAYQKVWTEAGSPLRVHGLALAEELAKALGNDTPVELAMRYGEPAIGPALDRLNEAGVDRVLAVPLFPQYASSSTGSALEALYREAGRRWNVPALQVLPPFFGDSNFLSAQTTVCGEALGPFPTDYVLFSFHGLPERQIHKSDESGSHCLAADDCCDRPDERLRHCYRAQCFATARGIASGLSLAPDRWSVSFQSRLGRTPWIRPYTDLELPRLREQGVSRLAVACPAFVADCLETVEEIGIRAREQWRELGGEALLLIPSLNAHPAWVGALARMLRGVASGL